MYTYILDNISRILVALLIGYAIAYIGLQQIRLRASGLKSTVPNIPKLVLNRGRRIRPPKVHRFDPLAPLITELNAGEALLIAEYCTPLEWIQMAEVFGGEFEPIADRMFNRLCNLDNIFRFPLDNETLEDSMAEGELLVPHIAPHLRRLALNYQHVNQHQLHPQFNALFERFALDKLRDLHIIGSPVPRFADLDWQLRLRPSRLETILWVQGDFNCSLYSVMQRNADTMREVLFVNMKVCDRLQALPPKLTKLVFRGVQFIELELLVRYLRVNRPALQHFELLEKGDHYVRDYAPALLQQVYNLMAPEVLVLDAAMVLLLARVVPNHWCKCVRLQVKQSKRNFHDAAVVIAKALQVLDEKMLGLEHLELDGRVGRLVFLDDWLAEFGIFWRLNVLELTKCAFESEGFYECLRAIPGLELVLN